MSFKIVQTRESDKAKKLSVIPYLWENDGQMQWPANTRQISQSKFNVMASDANSVPPEDWPYYKCTVKRDNLNHVDAVAMLKEMSGQSDTQASDNDMMPPLLSVQKRNSTRPSASVANFREMVKICFCFYQSFEKCLCFDYFSMFFLQIFRSRVIYTRIDF